MNTDILQGKWHQMKGKVKAHWGKLTDDDLGRVDGNTERLYGVLEERYGWTKEKVKLSVKEYLSKDHNKK
jgi:uncharacterized protein YjbJ (UPF0337 family)